MLVRNFKGVIKNEQCGRLSLSEVKSHYKDTLIQFEICVALTLWSRKQKSLKRDSCMYKHMIYFDDKVLHRKLLYLVYNFAVNLKLI